MELMPEQMPKLLTEIIFFNSSTFMPFFWVLVAIFFLFMEIGSPGLFFFIAFSLGSCVAAGVAIAGCSFTTQYMTALISSIIMFWVLKKYLANNKKNHSIKTNIEALIGVQAVVTQTIEPHVFGLVSVRGEEWVAQADEGVILQKGTVVIVVHFAGNRLMVKKPPLNTQRSHYD